MAIKTDEKFMLNPTSTGITPGVSLFTAIKNRKENFEEALQSWIPHKEISEIIIVDWDSEESLVPIIEKYQNGKIILAIVHDQPKWVLSFAYNLSARLTTRAHLLKMDADVKILPDFFASHNLQPGHFYCGNWRKRRNDNEMHLNGMVYLHREDFFRVNGYNEFIKFYGWDDSDLYQRLQEVGLKRIDFNYDTLFHIPHANRTIHQDTPEHLHLIPEMERATLATFTNRHLGNNYGKWSAVNRMLSFNISSAGNNLFYCDQIERDQNIVSAVQVLESETIAIRERILLLSKRFLETELALMKREELINVYHKLFLKKEDYPDGN